MLPGWTVNIGLNTQDSRRMETKAHIQRKCSNLEVQGFRVRFGSDLKERNQTTVSFKKICQETLLRNQLKFES